MKKPFLILLIGTLLLGLACTKTKEPSDLPVCQVARAKSAYTGAVPIPDEVKSHIVAYKKSWTDLCDRKEGASVHQTFVMAHSLEKKFNPIFSPKLTQTVDGKTDWKKTEAAHDYLQTDLPKFIPAFDGSLIEFEYFRPRFSDFKEIATIGNAEDKLFFQLHAELRGNGTLQPWYRMTWDYGGCLRFGEYDWIQSFQKLKKAKKIKATEYSKIISEQESSLKQTLGDLYFQFSDKKFKKICTCKEKSAVSADLEKIVTYLKKEKTHPKLVASLEKTLKAIKAGIIPLKSQAEKNCAGG